MSIRFGLKTGCDILRCRHRSRTPLMPPPPFWDPDPLGHHDELREPSSIKPPSPSPSRNCLHVGFHLRLPSSPGFTTIGSAPALHTSTSSPAPLSTSEPHYGHRQPPVGLHHRGEPFPVSFHFPRPSPTPPPTDPRRQQPLQQSIGMLIRIKATRW
jgi:hypothetical protein